MASEPTFRGQMLRPAKDGLEPNVPGVCRIPCQSVKVYVGQTGSSIETRCKEHQTYIRLHQQWQYITSAQAIASISVAPQY